MNAGKNKKKKKRNVARGTKPEVERLLAEVGSGLRDQKRIS